MEALSKMPNIILEPGAEEVGVAVMLADLMRQNLESSRIREGIFNALNVPVLIRIDDLDIEVTLVFEAGTLRIYGGSPVSAKIAISTESAYLLDLSNIDIRFGLPWVFDDQGKAILKNLKEGKIKISHSIFRVGDAIRLMRVMSINE